MRRLWRDRQGSVALLSAILIPALVTVVGFGVDLSNVYYNKSKIQTAADAAALGGVLSLPDSTLVQKAALSLVTANTPPGFGTLSATQDITVGNWDPATRTFSTTSANKNAVQVTAHRTSSRGNAVTTFFGSFLGMSAVDVNAKAIAVKYGGACVNVLDASASDAFNDSGNGQVSMNCALQVNSSSPTAARTKGSASVSTGVTCITGGYAGKGWTPVPQTGCPPLSDPLASLPEPSAPSTSCWLASSGTVQGDCTLTGAVSLSGSVNLGPGLYYLKNAQVTVGSNANLSGSGVTIFIDASSTLNLGGGGSLSLSAPTSGTYAGMLIFQSRSTPPSTVLTLGGNGAMSLDGSLYVPSATLSLTGNSSLGMKTGTVVCDLLTLSGSSNFTFNAFPAHGTTPRALRIHASLVE